MRYLHCQNIEIDKHNQQLSCAGQQVALAPKVYDLLLYFCQNSQRVISKDELMDNVWAGSIVTENAISRTLVKVRKALGDDPKAPQFIVTVPRKGYRLTQKFVASDSSIYGSAQSNSLSSQQFSVKPRVLSVALALSVLVVIGLLTVVVPSSDRSNSLSIKPLTRDVGQELFPAMSPDLKRIAYTIINVQGQSEIVIENLSQGERVKLSKPGFNLSRLAWASDSQQVAFLAKSKQECGIYFASLAQIKDIQTWRQVATCGRKSTPHIAFSPREHTLFFNDRTVATHGYQIFKLDLITGSKEILNQPITAGKGNYAFDISPSGDTLLMLNSEFSPVTAIYTLSLDGAKLMKTGQLNYLMRSAVFSHDGESIVHPSPHPAYELWQSTLAGKKLSIVASNTSRVKHMQRVNNGQDFVFVSYLLNRDLVYHGFDKENKSLISTVGQNNSSVMDYLPALANHADHYAFVSKRSTGAKVYLVKETAQGHSQAITISSFEHHVKLYHLAFSPDDTQLLVLADNQLFVIDINTHYMVKLPLNNQSIEGVSWHSKNKLLFSSLSDNRWHIKLYDLLAQEVTDIAQDYVGGVYLPKLGYYALIEQQTGEVFLVSDKGERRKALSMSCRPALSERQLNLHVLEDSTLLCPNGDGTKLRELELSDGVLSSSYWAVQPESLDFSVNQHGILATKMTQAIADVMTTISEK